MNDVQLLILQGGKVIYDYVKAGVTPPEKYGTRSYMDDYLEIRDVTHDGVPEVLFHSGAEGASDWITTEHILVYETTKASFTDVASEPFYNSGTHGLRWFALHGRAMVVIADRNWDATTIPLEDRCHYCPSPFQYDVYQWSRRKSSFVLQRHLYGKQSYSDASQALDGDWAFIQSKMNH